mmetsp:Transcript_20173/g.58344  ORF Transcript_20173/g.58344 Transcript_20173/m.58344 type:complete len:222 (+) Transcript_20173:671-1336(+)
MIRRGEIRWGAWTRRGTVGGVGGVVGGEGPAAAAVDRGTSSCRRVSHHLAAAASAPPFDSRRLHCLPLRGPLRPGAAAPTANRLHQHLHRSGGASAHGRTIRKSWARRGSIPRGTWPSRPGRPCPPLLLPSSCLRSDSSFPSILPSRTRRDGRRGTSRPSGGPPMSCRTARHPRRGWRLTRRSFHPPGLWSPSNPPVGRWPPTPPSPRRPPPFSGRRRLHR